MNEARRAVLLLQAQAQLPARKGSGASQAEAGKPRASHPQKPETCAGPKRLEARMSLRLSVSEAQSWKCVACAAAGRKACCPGTDDADGGGCQRGPPVLVCPVPVRRFMARGGGQGGSGRPGSVESTESTRRKLHAPRNFFTTCCVPSLGTFESLRVFALESFSSVRPEIDTTRLDSGRLRFSPDSYDALQASGPCYHHQASHSVFGRM